MPKTMIKNLAKDSGKSVKEVEELWDEIVKDVDKESKYFYPTVVKILKNKLGLNEDISFKEFVLIKEIK